MVLDFSVLVSDIKHLEVTVWHYINKTELTIKHAEKWK